MQGATALQNAPIRKRFDTTKRSSFLRGWLLASAPNAFELSLAALSALLLVLSFPNFNFSALAWLALVPLLVAITRQRPGHVSRSFLVGWTTGTLFFYGSCYWLTYAPIRYGQIPAPIAYALLLPCTMIVGLFPALFAATLARLIARFGTRAMFLAPFLWMASEWARFHVTGQLWNAVGYSQAYHPALIQTARFGGVYAVGFLLVVVNAALAYFYVVRTTRALMVSAAIISSVTLVVPLPMLLDDWTASSRQSAKLARSKPQAVVMGVQPNVPMEFAKSATEMTALLNRHVDLTESELRKFKLPNNQVIAIDERGNRIPQEYPTMEDWQMLNRLPRVVVWPESPMNFAYSYDRELREFVARFAQRNQVSVLFNSQEPAPAGGTYNAAVMVNEAGALVAQYDKIRLLPFGEYVPLPRWLPGVNLIPAMVGDFTPGAKYDLMPLGSSDARAGVFICFESAFPEIARRFAASGADVLINITNDGYLGPTPVMRQHLANAVFRAVENNRPVLRVTNTGISAYINERGEVFDATPSFQTATRTWTVSRSAEAQTFYTRHGDLFAAACAALSLIALTTTYRRKRVQ